MSTPTARPETPYGMTPADLLLLHRAHGVCEALEAPLKQRIAILWTEDLADGLDRLSSAQGALTRLACEETGRSIEHRYPAAQGWPKLKYTGNDGLKLMRVESVHCDHRLEVVGDPDNGTYEWGLRRADEGKLYAHSNDGYGEVSVALMYGLIHAHGYVSPKVESEVAA